MRLMRSHICVAALFCLSAGGVLAQNMPASGTQNATPAPAVAPIAPTALPPLPSGAPVNEQVDFGELVRNSLGLTPEQIRILRKEMDQRQKAASELPKVPPKPVSRMVQTSPAPGTTPPVIRLFQGYATSLILSDASGQPWPVENFAEGNNTLFEVKRMDGPGGSALSIVPLNPYASSNLVVYLKGLPTPVPLSLVSGQKEVDFRVDVRVQGRGPNTQYSVAGLPPATNTALTSVLEGVSPDGGKALRVSDKEAQAWLTKEGSLYLRTHLQVISPAWIGSMRSTDGMNVYEMQPVSSILVLREGNIERLTIQGL